MKAIKYILSLVLILAFAACSDDIMDDISINPNSPTEVPIKLLLPQTIASTVCNTYGTDLAWYSSVFVEHTTGVHGQLQDADRRQGINTTMANNAWNEIFLNLFDLNIIVERGSEGGKEEGNWAYVGMAKVMMAMNYSTAADMWGEVPFTESIKGSENRYPVFDSEQTIYNGCLALLNEGIRDLNRSSVGNPGAADYFYQGNTARWIKAANAYKARLFNRLSNVGPAAYNDSILACVSRSFADPSESLIFNAFTATATGEHTWYQEKNDRGHHAVSQTMDDLLSGLNDPRRALWFTLVGGSIVPAPNGTAVQDQGGEVYSRATPFVVNATAPLPIVTYDELKFLEAEANLRKGQNGNAYTAYRTAVERALLRAGINQADVTTYLAQGNVSVGSGNLTEEIIIIQKYLSFWLFQPQEAFCDYRRTGYPGLQNPVDDPISRFPYGNDEVANNPNVPDKDYKDVIWWAIK